MNGTRMHTPWGCPQAIEELAEGHLAGLHRRPRRLEAEPGTVGGTPRPWCRDSFLDATFAEEDCEEPIARTLLGIGDDREREFALKVANCFDRYRPGAAPPAGNRAVGDGGHADAPQAAQPAQ